MNMMMAIAQQRRRRKEFDPLSLSPALWYSDTGDNPAMWEDLSGFSRHATQGNETSQPELVTDELNGRQIRRFDAVDDFYQTGYTTPNLHHTGFAVVNQRVSSNLASGGYNSSALSAGRGGYDPNVYYLGTQSYSGFQAVFSAKGYKNGSDADIGFSGYPTGWVVISNVLINPVNITSTAKVMTVGCNKNSIGNNWWFSGMDMAEIILFPYQLTTSQRLQVENYLNNKWAIY